MKVIDLADFALFQSVVKFKPRETKVSKKTEKKKRYKENRNFESIM